MYLYDKSIDFSHMQKDLVFNNLINYPTSNIQNETSTVMPETNKIKPQYIYIGIASIIIIIIMNNK